MGKPDWEYKHEAIGAQGVYRALLAWYVDSCIAADRLSDSVPPERRRGWGEALVHVAMVTFGLDEEAATERAGDDLAEMRADRN